MMQQRSIKLAAAYTLFLLDRKARGFTPLTVRYYEQKLGAFVAWVDTEDGCALDQLDAATIRGYLVQMQERGLKDSTTIGAARAIRAFCNFAVAEGWLGASPMATVPNPKAARHILPALSAEDVHKLLTTAADARTRAVVMALLDTGLRAAEMAKLDGDDIDLRTGAVRVREGKGRKDRTVYLGAKSRRSLLAYYSESGWPDAHEAVWRNERTGARLTDSGLRQLLQTVGAAAAVPNCTPHTFRRTFALECLRGGMNIHALARLMGHADIQVLRQYLSLVEADLKAAHAAAGPVDRLLR